MLPLGTAASGSTAACSVVYVRLVVSKTNSWRDVLDSKRRSRISWGTDRLYVYPSVCLFFDNLLKVVVSISLLPYLMKVSLANLEL